MPTEPENAGARGELLELTRGLRRRAAESDSAQWQSSQKTPRGRDVAVEESSQPVSFDELSRQIEACRACPLGATRIKAVTGVGSSTAEVMFIGEGPGFDEDHKGEPFVGRSGQLLDKIMASIGLSRPTVYIANIVKCHPMVDPTDPEKHGNDRPPTPEEVAACRHWLDAQIRTISPRFIVTLGAVPARVLLGDATPISKIRGQWRQYDPGAGAKPVRLLPTFHPAALLRNPNLKVDVWNDMKNLKTELSKND